MIKKRVVTGLLLNINDVKTAQCYCITSESHLALNFIIASFCIFIFIALVFVIYEFCMKKRKSDLS